MATINIEKVREGGRVYRPYNPETDYYREFGSIAEVHKWLDGEGSYENVKANKDMCCGRSHMSSSIKPRGRPDWDGAVTWDEAFKLSYEGWEEGAERLRIALEKLDDFSPTSSLDDEAEGIELVQSDEGEMFMPDEYFAGEENFMMDIRFKTHKPIIRICCNISASAGVQADDMIARGMVIAATVRKLERLGYGVQVWVGDASLGGGGISVNLVRIKDSSEYIDDRALAFWLGHPAALRRIFFRFIEATPRKIDVGMSYGMPSDFTSPDFDLVSPSAHLNVAHREKWWNNPEAAAKATEGFINQILSGVKREEVPDEDED
jgi:hypothetical protein